MSADPRDRFRNKAAEKKADAQQAAGADKSKFVTLSIAELLALPLPEYLIEGILISGGFGGIYGPPGSLKSFICLSMALAVAYGERWCGREVKQHAVLYVAGEGVGGLGQRIRAWQKHFGREGVSAPFRVLTKGVNLTDPVETAHLILAATEAAEAEGQAIGFIIIDTVARAMVGADENSAQDMGEFNEACADLIRGIEGAPTVLAVHHSGKDTDRGSRGSTSFPGAVDSMLKVSRDDDRLTLKVEKQKDGRDGFDVALKKLDVMEDGAKPDDLPLSLVVVDASEDPKARKTRKAASLTPAAQLAFSALAGAINQFGSYRKGLANVPGHVKSVTELEWRAAYYTRSASPSQEAKATAFKRAHEMLAAKEMVVLVDSFVWIVDGGCN